MAEIKPLIFEQLKERVGKPVYWPNDLIYGNLWGIVDFDQSYPDDLWFCSCHNGVSEYNPNNYSRGLYSFKNSLKGI